MKFSSSIIASCLTILFVTNVLAEVTQSSSTTEVKPPTNPTTQSPTSTAAPTTTTTATTSTSTSTTTTTTPKPAPQPDPKPTPTPSSSSWIVNGTNGTICIMASMGIEFSVTFKNISNKPFLVNVTQQPITVSGECGDDESTMKLSWLKPVNSIVLHFMNYNKTNKKYALHHMEVELAPANFIGSNITDSVKLMLTKSLPNITLGNSYVCKSLSKINLDSSNDTVQHAVMKLTDLHFQAFEFKNSSQYGAPENCLLETSDIVPIAVGCVLAGLVVIVLVAYLITRRRRGSGGYLSM